MAVTNALIKAGEKALAKGSQKAIEKATTKAVSKVVQETADKAVAKAITKGLTGAGASTMAKNAGSTLDGILGRSSGLTLPEATKPVSTNLAKEFAGTDLAKTAKQELTDVANRNNKLVTDLASDPDNMWFSKRELEGSDLNKYWKDQGVKKMVTGGANSGFVPAEYPELNRMIKEGKLSPIEGAETWGKGINKQKNYTITGDLNYNDKSALLEAIKDHLPEDEAMAVGNLEPEDFVNENQLRLIDQTKTPTERKIEIEKPRSRMKRIDVTSKTPARQEANLAPEVTDTATSSANPALMDEIASMKEKLGSAGGSGSGMGGNIGGGTTTEMPGSDGFNVKLKDGSTTNIKLQPEAVGPTKQQKAIRKLDDMTAKSMNANAKQYRNIVGKSGSIDGYYKTVAERMRAEKIHQANVAQKAQNALSLREAIKQQGLAYAEANGVTIDLSGIDNTLGMSATQKRKLAELGLSLNDMLGGATEVTPSQAEDIYKTLRDYAYNWSDSKDALTSMAGNACKKEADAVRDLIDNTMDNINVNYKVSLLEDAAKNGEDPKYLRKLSGKKDFKFSDLRKDQSDWITINDLAGNKIKDEPTLNMFGVDTGMKNPFTAGAEKLKEKYYERQAYGGGTGGNFSGGSGAEGSINFEDAGAGRTGTLGNILNKGKDAGLVGAGILGGLMLGGGGSQGGSGGLDGINTLPTADTAQEQAMSDPYANATIGGYTYDQLEAGYVAAMQAGDTDAAKIIANMIDMLDSKVKRTKDESESSGTASKQKAALNVLSGLMQNYQAQGPIGGRVTGLLNTLTGGGYNPAVAAYDSGAQGSLGTIIKALGDTGALSEGDQKRALELLPRTTDSKEAAQYKYQQLIQILQGAGAQ